VFDVDGAGVEIVGDEDVLFAASRHDREATVLIRVYLTGCIFNFHELIMCACAW